jgi:hypothetical protein
VALDWLTCSNGMGADTLAATGIESFQVIAELRTPTTADDTKEARRRFLELGGPPKLLILLDMADD